MKKTLVVILLSISIMSTLIMPLFAYDAETQSSQSIVNTSTEYIVNYVYGILISLKKKSISLVNPLGDRCLISNNSRACTKGIIVILPNSQRTINVN